MSSRNGVVAGGNWILDRVKMIDVYPQQDALANVLGETTSNGGSAYNVLKDLARLEAPFPLEAIGVVGDDEDGKRIFEDCKANSIDTKLLRLSDKAPTSYTEVMTVRSTGRRTFFHQRGANAYLGDSHFPFALTRSAHLHLGYLLLLDELDRKDSDFGTVAARVLARAKRAGLSTSIDLVSEDSARFQAVVRPALRYTDVCFMNEFEAERTSGMRLADGPERVAADIMKHGINHSLVIHTETGATAWSRHQMFTQPAVAVPADLVASSVGAGDAFAAGYLYGFIVGSPIAQCLRNAVSAAASCVMAPGCSDGILPMAECLALAKKYGYRVDNLASLESRGNASVR